MDCTQWTSPAIPYLKLLVQGTHAVTSIPPTPPPVFLTHTHTQFFWITTKRKDQYAVRGNYRADELTGNVERV